MRPAVVFLPDTALLVPGAAGREDPGAALREEALALLGAAVPELPPDVPADPATGVPVGRAAGVPAGRAASAPVLVVAPGHVHRTLRHPVATGLGAAGLPAGRPDAPPGPDARRADVPASVALTLLRAAGVTAAVDVVELPRDPDGDAPDVPDVPVGVVLLVVVGSPSARHGDAAPLAEDPRAADADAALLAGLAGGPAALAEALDALGPRAARELAVSAWPTWRVAAAAAEGPVRVSGPRAEVVAGAWHVVAAWRPHAQEAL
ncbi:hypothetical protein [Cellulomonas sp. C5510]|uniref:hypothetical protein n=1 Tax=Cellulomonas sp. C5510 TaxID=2871170 RepID=UPI001C9488FE|nr:hypothetical protein [Cellulomonas sp. C5510]QZN84493.1 hypothetical protein K5O09_11545 [Cellulomonas sp. C5510]